MNIFFNSRINANQSLLNVLFGQQQKAASSQNTGCRGTRDTLTISASGKEKLMKKNVPVEQMLKYLGYENLTREMLEEYVKGIYVYDDGRVEVEYK